MNYFLLQNLNIFWKMKNKNEHTNSHQDTLPNLQYCQILSIFLTLAINILIGVLYIFELIPNIDDMGRKVQINAKLIIGITNDLVSIQTYTITTIQTISKLVGTRFSINILKFTCEIIKPCPVVLCLACNFRRENLDCYYVVAS